MSDETVRRWVRSGRLAARRDGPRHLIDAAALDALTSSTSSFPIPDVWLETPSGDGGPSAHPDWVVLVRRLRGERTG